MDTAQLLKRLGPDAQRGSKPRCHMLTHGSTEHVAPRLTSLIEPYGQVTAGDKWMPEGFEQTDEAELDKADRLLPEVIRNALREWWLAVDNRSRTPNWDIASTCTIEGKRGLLLVEAKAYDVELIWEEKGKTLAEHASPDSVLNHFQISGCLAQASVSLTEVTGQTWRLSRDSHYQLANRFAWCWKLTSLGLPVILVYLGFLGASDMADKGAFFESPEDWHKLLIEHSRTTVPAGIWNQRISLNGQPFIPLIRTCDQPLLLDW